MKTRQLGNSDLQITPIGLGAWAMGGADWEYGWGPQDDQNSVATIRHAIESGINWIDTAAVYGLGHSEAVVGQAVIGLHNPPYIFTKCSLVWDEDRSVSASLKAESLRREVEESLRRLDVDVIDLYQIHWPNPAEDIEEGWRTLAKMQDEGKLRYIGVSNFSVKQMKRCHDIAPITSLQPPYSIISRDIEKNILPYCEAQNIGVIVYSPLQSGLLSGKMTRERVRNMPESDWRSRDSEFTEPRLTRNLKIADVLKDIAAEHNTTAASIAVAWTLNHSAITGAIVGARRPDQVDGFIDAPDLQLTRDNLRQIEDAQQSVG
jgi:aryl-alcohol dehydrogenase-like predicted oxidoreductase